MAQFLVADDPVAVAVAEGIQSGDIPASGQLLAERPELATARN